MAKMLGREELAVWQRHIEEQADSGLTHERYCREHGLSLHAFRAWKYRERRLRVRDDPKMDGAPVKFVPVRVIPPEPRGMRWVEVVLREGRVVRVGAEFDEETLARVVRALERAGC